MGRPGPGLGVTALSFNGGDLLERLTEAEVVDQDAVIKIDRQSTRCEGEQSIPFVVLALGQCLAVGVGALLVGGRLGPLQVADLSAQLCLELPQLVAEHCVQRVRCIAVKVDQSLEGGLIVGS